VTKRARLVQSDVDRPERSTSIGDWFAHLVPGRVLERMTGIEPALSAWEADVLPLNYIRERVGSPLESSGCAWTGSVQTKQAM
jgi:hypothetical protein